MEVDDRLAELNPKTRTCVVLGGRGFLGRSLVLKLLELGKWIVRIADSAQSLQLDPSESDSSLSHAISKGRASYHCVDVRNRSLILKAVEGSSVVFYMDDADLRAHDFYLCYMIIVQGAKNVINACRDGKVRRLIYSSSADVIFNGSCDINNGDESLRYPGKFENILSDLKAQAEALILHANDIDGLLTCAIRPCNVFGPGDTHLVPYLVNLAKSGWAKFIIGNGENMSDFTYVENVSHAHICAEEALDFRTSSVAGKAFFITNLDPMKFWDFVSHILEGLGYQRPFIKLPARMVLDVFMFIKRMHEKFGFIRYNHSLLVHYVHLGSCSRTFNCNAAQKHIGYSPIVSLQEGIALTIGSFSHLAKDMSFSRCSDLDEPSKADKLLGSGKVAEVLLWRDERKSFTYFIALVLLFYWFFLCGRTFVTSAAYLLLLLSFILYGYGILPPNIYGFTVKRLSSSCFETSEMVVKDSIQNIVHFWNGGMYFIRSVAHGQDWKVFLKVVASIYFLKLILSQFVTTFIGMALVFAFTAFFVYEQYEPEIDGLAKHLINSIKGSAELLTRILPPSAASFLCSYEPSINRTGGPPTVKGPK
ncbi:3beta-hydroxysteroid-dehydrogenase/decarboxylase [Ziziphus jujuba]|uniref:Reticulon-like protein n=2 Tax=Ziziphus jujuba TaxID=326968 RepID=A0ABM3IRF7_ZIZJJ|nr:3beta-hydroxysteroid-dehydrogenase/decarboxylase [Ziziphus jujuba]KAH7521373.1 hypothetical protein FEM48_Zijuj07G0026300 [Ziziphus jujuba var. spinosa]